MSVVEMTRSAGKTARAGWIAAGIFAACSILVGCGARSTIDDTGGSSSVVDASPGDVTGDTTPTDSGFDVKYDVLSEVGSCGPECRGCCDDTGTCRTGLAVDACGSDGFACVDCTRINAPCDATTRQCGPPQPCSAETCPDGCCSSTGGCETGRDADACGRGGQACLDCAAQGLSCDVQTRECATPPSCGPWNCDGCCENGIVCLSGTSDSSCGARGVPCSNCREEGLSCDPDTLQCVGSPDCGPWNCPGCCDFSGACWPGFEEFACGIGGGICEDCTMFGGRCDPFMGGCIIEDCGPWNCPGCCSMWGTCEWGGSNFECGSGGSFCQDCSMFGQTCDPLALQCVSGPACGPANCPGCCDSQSGECMPGFEPFACGGSGQVCQDCTGPSQQCVPTSANPGGVCITTQDCGPGTCDGCCDCFDPTLPCQCVPGFEPWACGHNGQVCQTCWDPNQVCEPYPNGGGQCLFIPPPPDCGPHNCPSGCCDSSVWPPICVEGLDPFACGNGGQVCERCTPNTMCQPLPWGGGFCEDEPPPPDCGPWNCAGCCQLGFPSICVEGMDQFACGTDGATCEMCAPGEECIPNPWGIGGRCGDDPPPPVCGPWNCAGCCNPQGECRPGFSDFRCGQGGVACQNCLNVGGTCEGGFCTGTTTCPAEYPGCPPASSTEPPYTAVNACDSGQLLDLEFACSGDPTPQTCQDWLLMTLQTDPECGECLLQFTGSDAAIKCVSPYLTDTCNHELTCSIDCIQVACSQCPEPEQDQCQQDVLWNGGTCSGYTDGVWCYQAAVTGPASFCDFVGDYGNWIRVVGEHYCGSNGP